MEKINFKRKYFNFEPSQIIDENNNNESILSTVCMKIYKSNDKINIIEYFESLKMILLNNIDLKILETFEKYNIIDIFINTFLNQEYLIDFIYNFIAICSAHEDEVSQYLISKNFLTFAKNDFNRVKNKNDIICLLSNICGCSVECRNAVLDAFSLEHLCSLFLSDSSLRNNLNVLFMNLTKYDIPSSQTQLLLCRVLTVILKNKMIINDDYLPTLGDYIIYYPQNIFKRMQYPKT